MPRIRTIKPEFPQSESMGRVSREARLLFVLLFTVCDDAGRTRAASRMLASLLYPYDDDAGRKIDGWMAELEAEKCVVRYQVDGSTYLEVCNWLSHQKIDRPSASKIPAFDESSRVIANPREPSSGDLDLDRDLDQRTKDHVGQEPDDVVLVFDHWKTVHGKPRSRLDDKRRKLIRAALKDYPPDVLRRCIDGYKRSTFHQGKNDRGAVYDSIELMLRDAKQIDQGVAFADTEVQIQW
jgi:hypothetical protein